MVESYKKEFSELKKILQKEGILDLVKQIKETFSNGTIYLVGGTVRDILLHRGEYVDFDLVVGNVRALDLEKFLSRYGEVDLVGKSFGVFKFKFAKDVHMNIDAIDIALPRTDHSFMTGGYKDFDVQSDPSLPIESDLSRRDFTINAMAINLVDWTLVDIFSGVEDLRAKLIRTVGEPKLRFAEDYTRMMRAVRFSCQLGFEIDNNTSEAIKKYSSEIGKVSSERIRDEFTKIIMSNNAEQGIRILHEFGLLLHVVPELEEGFGIMQNKSHKYTIFEHNVRSLGFATQRDYSFDVRLAALFHDIGKSRTKQGEGVTSTFFNHEYAGAKMTQSLLRRLKYSNDVIKNVTHFVKHHMFYYSLGEITDAGVRRLLARLGKDYIYDFIKLRICDRLGMGRPKAKPYKLLELERRLQIVQMDPISPKMLALNGHDIMRILNIAPGPRIGRYTKALLSQVLDDPKRNTKEYLEEKLKEFHLLSDEDLAMLAPDIDYFESERHKEFFDKYDEVE